MALKEKDKSLLEIAIEILRLTKGPQPIMTIAKKAMETKGLKTAAGQQAMPQFLADFMESGYFVYCGKGQWDLKERQSTAVLDKDGIDSEVYDNVDDDVKNNELQDEFYDNDDSSLDRDDDNDDAEEDDDIASMLDDGDDDDYQDDVETGYEEIDDEE